jgi:hypothetical protein
MQAVEEIKGQSNRNEGDQNRQSERDSVHGSVHVGSVVWLSAEGGSPEAGVDGSRIAGPKL